MEFYYESGKKVELGDIVKTDVFGHEEEAIVDSIIQPHSKEAKEYYFCDETGGVLFKIGKQQGLMLMPSPDEHFELKRRKKQDF